MNSDALTYAWLVGVLATVLSTVVGWTMRRLWSHVDALGLKIDSIESDLSSLRGNLIDRSAFDRHIEREEAQLISVRDEIRRVADAMQVRADTMVREHQETRILIERALVRGAASGGK